MGQAYSKFATSDDGSGILYCLVPEYIIIQKDKCKIKIPNTEHLIKFGRSGNSRGERIHKGYGSKTKLLSQVFVTQQINYEKKLLKLCRSQFGDPVRGDEYFECSESDAFTLFRNFQKNLDITPTHFLIICNNLKWHTFKSDINNIKLVFKTNAQTTKIDISNANFIIAHHNEVSMVADKNAKLQEKLIPILNKQKIKRLSYDDRQYLYDFIDMNRLVDPVQKRKAFDMLIEVGLMSKDNEIKQENNFYYLKHTRHDKGILPQMEKIIWENRNTIAAALFGGMIGMASEIIFPIFS